MTTPSGHPWDLPLVDVPDRNEFVACIRWLSGKYPGRFERDVKMFCEPPYEAFHDKTWLETHKYYDAPSIVAGATLMSIYPGIVEEDPRPTDQRPTPWWREKCHVREDLLTEFRNATKQP